MSLRDTHRFIPQPKRPSRRAGVFAPLTLATFAMLAVPAASCSQVPVMRGELEGLHSLATQAERNGAMRCAPRELAMAKSNISFAEIEIEQGFFARAKEHVDIAKSNAHAAYDLSPPQKCAERT